jgi:hypothetical protein
VQILHCDENGRDIFQENFKPCLNYVGLFPNYIKYMCYKCATMGRIVLFNSQKEPPGHPQRTYAYTQTQSYTRQSLWQKYSAERSHTTAAHVSKGLPTPV